MNADSPAPAILVENAVEPETIAATDTAQAVTPSEESNPQPPEPAPTTPETRVKCPARQPSTPRVSGPCILPAAEVKWPLLTASQLAQMEAWLFEEKVRRDIVVKRCETQFQVTVDIRELAQWERELSRARHLEQIAGARETALAVVKLFTDKPVDAYRAFMNLASQVAFTQALECAAKKKKPGDDGDAELDADERRRRIILEFGKMLVEAHKEDRQERELDFEREKWRFDIVTACRKHLAEIQSIERDEYADEDAKFKAIHRRLFGTELEE